MNDPGASDRARAEDAYRSALASHGLSPGAGVRARDSLSGPWMHGRIRPAAESSWPDLRRMTIAQLALVEIAGVGDVELPLHASLLRPADAPQAAPAQAAKRREAATASREDLERLAARVAGLEGLLREGLLRAPSGTDLPLEGRVARLEGLEVRHAELIEKISGLVALQAHSPADRMGAPPRWSPEPAPEARFRAAQARGGEQEEEGGRVGGGDEEGLAGGSEAGQPVRLRDGRRAQLFGNGFRDTSPTSAHGGEKEGLEEGSEEDEPTPPAGRRGWQRNGDSSFRGDSPGHAGGDDWGWPEEPPRPTKRRRGRPPKRTGSRASSSTSFESRGEDMSEDGSEEDEPVPLRKRRKDTNEVHCPRTQPAEDEDGQERKSKRNRTAPTKFWALERMAPVKLPTGEVVYKVVGPNGTMSPENGDDNGIRYRLESQSPPGSSRTPANDDDDEEPCDEESEAEEPEAESEEETVSVPGDEGSYPGLTAFIELVFTQPGSEFAPRCRSKEEHADKDLAELARTKGKEMNVHLKELMRQYLLYRGRPVPAAGIGVVPKVFVRRAQRAIVAVLRVAVKFIDAGYKCHGDCSAVGKRFKWTA